MRPPDHLTIVRGPIGDDEARRLEESVRAGAAVLLAPGAGDEHGARLAGARPSESLPRTEWFVTLTDLPEAVRLDGEVPITSGLRPLDLLPALPGEPPAEVVATTSVGYRHRPTITRRTIGAGCVIASGVEDLEALVAHPTLGRFVSRLARSPGSVRRPRRDLGVAVVGYGPYGGMGYTHGLACQETEGLRLVAAVDTSSDRLKAAQDDFPDLVGYATAAEAAADPDVDVAIIATPPVLHAELARELLAAGTHVVVEKPMCLTAADADSLLAAAAAAERTITVHQSRRWDRDYLAVRRAVDHGLLGEVFDIETFVGGFDHPCRAWHSEEAVSGGAVYDWGSHHVDWILQLHGTPPARLLCTTHRRVWHDSTNVDQLTVWMQWSDGREATFRQSDLAAIRRPKFLVQGTDGTLEGHYRLLRDEAVEPGRGHVERWLHHAEAPADLRLVRHEAGYGLVESLLPPAPPAGWAFHRNLADHLLLGEPLAVDPHESREVVRVLEAAHASGAAGGELVEL